MSQTNDEMKELVKEQKTDKEILGELSKYREPSAKGKGGRPQVNRELVIRNLKAQDHTGNPRYTHAQIARLVGCSDRTVRRILNEAREEGLLDKEERTGASMGMVEADFNNECLRAMGIGFREWLQTKFKRKDQANYTFNFTSKIWESLWDKCSIVELADEGSKLADQCAIKFVSTFQDDKTSMRRRLKIIRFLFRFCKRYDVCEAHLKMSTSRHPRAKRKVPEITFTNFPQRLESCIAKMKERLGAEAELLLRFKIATQMRTGAWKSEGKPENRELFGLSVGDPESSSYLIMESPDEYQGHIYAKKGEEWEIIWLPKPVREALWAHYQTRPHGAPLFTYSPKTVQTAWAEITKEEFERPLKLHDLRKVSITWLYAMGISLVVAANMNVGWIDLSTAYNHYLSIKPILRLSKRQAYREKIPEWFKEGLDDFIGHDAVISQPQGFAGSSFRG